MATLPASSPRPPQMIFPVDDIRVRDRPAVVLGAPVEQSSRDLGSRIAGLGGTVIKLGELQVAVTVGVGQVGREAADLRFLVFRCCRGRTRRPDCCQYEPRQTGRRIDHRETRLVVCSGHVKRIHETPAHLLVKEV